MAAYYNEIDPFAAQWLRNLIEAGHIAPGDVDERSITDIKPDELKHYKQCHFFAGIGVWSYSLRRAGWGDSRPVWTGSCPCQPFSVAGKGKGTADERHLWPTWYELVKHCKPAVIFGEQVASSEVVGKSDGSGENVWIDIVQTDMERASYSIAPFDLPAAGFGAPHIRPRVYFVAERLGNAGNARLSVELSKSSPSREKDESISREATERTSTSVGRLGNPSIQSCKRRTGAVSTAQTECGRSRRENGNHGNRHSDASETGRVANTDGGDASTEREQRGGEHGQQPQDSISGDRDTRPGPVNGIWSGADWIGCRDDKFRPVESGTFPLANGATQRVGRLRAYGNAICAEVATGFISAYLETEH